MTDELAAAITLAERAFVDNSEPPESLIRMLDRLAGGTAGGPADRLEYLAGLSAELGLVGPAVRLLRSPGGTSSMKNFAGVIVAEHGDLDTAIGIWAPLADAASIEPSVSRAVLTNLVTISGRLGRTREAAQWAERLRETHPFLTDPVAALQVAETGPDRTLLTAAVRSFPTGDPRAVAVAASVARVEFDRIHESGDLDSAELMVDAMEAASQVLGSTLGQANPQSALARANHASALFDIALDRGDIDEARAALPLIQEAAEALQRAWGAGHPSTVIATNNLAIAQVELAKTEQDPAALRAAADGLLDAWRSTVRQLGRQHPEALHLLVDMGTAELDLTLRNPSRAVIDAAVRVNQRAITVVGRALGADHLLVRRATSQLRECRRIASLSARAKRSTEELDCAEVLAEVYLFLDLESTDERRDLIVAHLEECAGCLREYGIEQEVKALVARGGGGEKAPRDLRLRLLSKLAGLTESAQITDATRGGS